MFPAHMNLSFRSPPLGPQVRPPVFLFGRSAIEAKKFRCAEHVCWKHLRWWVIGCIVSLLVSGSGLCEVLTWLDVAYALEIEAYAVVYCCVHGTAGQVLLLGDDPATWSVFLLGHLGCCCSNLLNTSFDRQIMCKNSTMMDLICRAE